MGITIAEAGRRWKAARDSMIDMTREAIVEKETDVLNLVKAQLYTEGIDGYGNQLHQYADAYTAHDDYSREKNDMNPGPGYGNPDLYYTGRFYQGYRLIATADSIEITSDDEKTDFLINGAKRRLGYGTGVFKMDQESKNVVRKEIIQPYLVHGFADKTGAMIG